MEDSPDETAPTPDAVPGPATPGPVAAAAPSGLPGSGPAPAAAVPTPGPVVTRRRVLGAGVAVVLAGGAGVALAAVEPRDRGPQGQAPQELTDAIAAERALLADLDATLAGADAATRAVLGAVRDDHRAHERALLALAAGFAPPSATAAPQRPGRALGRAALRGAEQRAAGRAAVRSARLAGTTAVVLASIAACEASHAELLA